MQDIPRKL